MKSGPTTTDSQRPVPNEVEGLKRALDRAYASLRDRAYGEWQYRYGGMREAADSSVSVRVTGATRHLRNHRLETQASSNSFSEDGLVERSSGQ